jgi:FkbH-like protein
MSSITWEMPWLPAAPPDFQARCRAIGTASARPGDDIQRLAGYRLSEAQSASLGKAIKRCRGAGLDLAPLSPVRLGVLSSATLDLVIDAMPAAAARHGVALDVTRAPYDQILQEAFDPDSAVNRARLDVVLVAADHRWLGLDSHDLGGGAANRVRDAIEKLRSVIERLRDLGGAPAIIQTVPTPPLSLFGGYDRRVAGTVRAALAEFNRDIVALAAETGAYILDVASLAERVGADTWYDPIQWYAYKLPFWSGCGLAYADALGRLLGAIRGKSRKCLVLDLDNTVWGGVIGDDGMEGIAIGQGSPLGEAFLAVQRMALDLRDRGVMLAVSSKNTDEVARRPFREHPDMLLRDQHITVFQANWLDKPSNLEAIARTLNIGLDALVFLDDNPAERAQVRAALPMVAVPELPADPGWYPLYLSSAGFFEAVSFSSEDRLRVESYASDAQRAEVMQKSRDLGDYLGALDMTITFAPFDLVGRQRIVQLINKSNQFNLTTRRYTEAEAADAESDPAVFTLQVRLADRFGDLGMISVVICRPDPVEGAATWLIDTWLMSCRVLGRKVEEAVLRRICAEATARGVSLLRGVYIPTAKNSMVRDHYAKLGFALIREADDRSRIFELPLDGYVAPELPMAVADLFPGPLAG